MDIKILGGGCANCKKLEKNTRKAADELNVDYTLEKVTDFKDIVTYGVLSTPALVIDNEVKISGRVVKADEIKKMLK